MLCVLINAMEVPLLSSQQFTFLFPVGLVIVFAVLVFAFGFRSSVEPPSFKYISSAADDRKNTKKKKIKDKKPQSNGHATVLIDVVDSKKADSTKAKQATKVETPKPKKNVDVDKAQEKKADVLKSPSKKEKKASKKSAEIEKPSDFDEGEWEVAPSRKDKKSKKKDDTDVVFGISKKKSGTKRDDKLTILEAEPIEILRIEDILPKPKEIVELTPTPIPDPEPIAAPQPAADDQAAKKKKAKKTKAAVNEDVAAPQAAAPEPAPPAAPAVAPEPVSAAPDTLMAFNELEDAWKEAPQKKSKKKVRKD